MTRILPAFLLMALFASCSETISESYSIKGSSVLPDGKLYLLAQRDSTVKSIDSCDVVHGSFMLNGRIDSTTIGQLIMEQFFAIPVVLEQGDIKVTIERTTKRVSGTMLNDQLYDYLDKHIQLINRSHELERRATQMLLEGYDEQEIRRQIQAEQAVLPRQKDSLETHFIVSNYDNVLGPFAFQMLTEEIMQVVGYPMMTPQLEEIMLKATDRFRTNDYVSGYCRAANDIMARIKEQQQQEAGLDDSLPVQYQP